MPIDSLTMVLLIATVHFQTNSSPVLFGGLLAADIVHVRCLRCAVVSLHILTDVNLLCHFTVIAVIALYYDCIVRWLL